MFRPTASRMAAATRPLARPQTLNRVAIPRPVALPKQTVLRQQARQYADHAPQTGGGGNNQLWIILGGLAALGVGGYIYLKPIRDVAAKANQTAEAVKSGGEGLSDSVASLAQGFLPPGAYAIYSQVAKHHGGAVGFLTSLKDKDLQGVIDEVKKVGGDDAKRIIDKVEQKLKDAGGKVENLDWPGLAQDLKAELPASQQKMVDMFIGKLPSKDDFDQYIKKAKDIGQDRLKEIEDASKRVMDQVEKARKEGKSQADAFLAGIKDAAPADIDSLIKQLKDAANKAGLPADTAESWLRSKAADGKIDAEDMAKQLQGKLQTAAKFFPGQPKDVTDQVSQLSPSLAKLLSQAMQQAGVSDEQGNKKTR